MGLVAHNVGRAVSAGAATSIIVLAVACGSTQPSHPGTVRTPTVSPAASLPGADGPVRSSQSPAATPGTPAPPLARMVVGIDPGHNGLNGTDPSYINSMIWNGRQWETCDTTGTQTDAGYPEALFTFRVAMFLRADLRRDGARVVMTRSTNQGVGPCVNRRAQMINHNHANVAIDIHADGGPPGGRGFTVLEPVADGPNNNVIAASQRFGSALRRAMLTDTAMPVSTYDGVDGITYRNDLAGLNLTRVPKVLVECGNMRNATDASLLTSTVFQRQLARAFEAAIIRFLRQS